MSLSGNGINSYLHNMNYKNRMYSNTQNTNSEELKKNNGNQEPSKQTAVNTNKANIKLKIEEQNEIQKLPEKLPPYSLGNLMDYKI